MSLGYSHQYIYETGLFGVHHEYLVLCPSEHSLGFVCSKHMAGIKISEWIFRSNRNLT
jgi:hypothetical protein